MAAKMPAPAAPVPVGGLEAGPLDGVEGFGAVIRCEGGADVDSLVAARADLPAALHRARGLLVVKGLSPISDDPRLLVRLSEPFGPEVENYHHTLSARNTVHETVPQILVLSNLPPSSTRPPARPDPPLTAAGELPTRFPHRRGWHTDQSFRRPPPDISLFYAVIPAPPDQGQTLFANCIAAYAALPDALRRRIRHLVGLHVMPKTGRSEFAVRDGETPMPLLPHQRPQRQPVVRRHAVTGEPALYLCEAGQMDWIEGPFVGMEPGPDGDGAKLLYELMTHLTRPEFTYAHHWEAGDLVVWDNRSLVHAATWFDADAHRRLMWRTTVRGNPGPEYAGERRSWIPAEAPAPADG